MKVYYVLDVNNESLIGYTENEYLYNKYVSQFTNGYNILNGIVEAPSVKDFLNKFNQSINNQLKTPFRIDEGSKLYSIKDSNSDEIMVVTKLLYRDFIHQFCDTRELNKIQNTWYRHVGHYGYGLNKYIVDEDDRLLINDLFYTIMTGVYAPVKEYLHEHNNYQVFADLIHGYDAEIWEYINEYYEIKRYFEICLNTTQFIFGIN